MTSSKEKLLNAVKAFEKSFQCHLSVHDYTGILQKYLPELPFYHLNPFCTILKYKADELTPRCIAFDRNSVQNRLSENPEAFLKLCHCGITEIVIPIFINEEISGALFVGPYKWDTSRVPADFLRSREKKLAKPDLNKMMQTVPPLSSSTAKNVMALGTTLAICMEKIILGQISKNEFGGLSRKDKIQAYITRFFRNNISLQDLASHLGLCESRTSQLVKHYFSESFPELLMDKRLEHAESLLLNSTFKLETIADYSGFNDSSYFFRAFKKKFGISPGIYRRNNAN
jgi:AraC-like DNA-binding protein